MRAPNKPNYQRFQRRQVQAIRFQHHLFGMSYYQIARYWGCNKTAPHAICVGESHKETFEQDMEVISNMRSKVQKIIDDAYADWEHIQKHGS